MKKSRLKNGSDFLWSFFPGKTLLLRQMMAWLVISLTAFQLHAKDSLPEEEKISLVKEFASVKEILKEVERQTEFRFFYNHQQVDVNRTISIHLKEVTLTQALEEIFKSTSISYKISGRQILLFRMDKALFESHSKGLLPTSFIDEIKDPAPLFTVSGTVTSETGESMPGANVIQKGTTNGTTTDADGRYSLSLSEGDAVLVFSFIGYTTQEVAVNGRSVVDVILAEDVRSLEEIVVVGYGEQKKATATGSVSSVKGDEIRHSPATNLTNSLVGRLSGLTAVTRTGEPGIDGSVLRIRGSNTLGENNPLVVVDGIANRSFERLNPADIESITILKDASAAIYGAQAANGVILVTTRRGKSGKPKISLNLNRGFNQPTRIPKMADASQFASMQNEMAFYANESLGRFQKYSAEDIQKYSDGSDPWGHPNTDWFKEVFKPWSRQSYANISLSGGTENIKYFLTLGTRYEDGYYKNSVTNYNQYDFRSNIDAKVSKNISVSFDVAGSQESRVGPIRHPFRSLLRGHPTAPARWPDGSPGPDYQEFGDQPVVTSTLEPGYDKSNWYRLQSNARINITIPWIEGLSVQGNASFDKDFNTSKRFEKPWYLYNWDGNPDHKLVKSKSGLLAPQLTQGTSDGQRVTLNAYATYERTIRDEHNIKLMGGIERQNGNTDIFSAFRKNYISQEIEQLFAGANDQFMTNTGSASHNARLNYFGRINYDYSQKYLLEFVWRYDGSYIFPQGKQFGFFPGISGGWRISEEKFWKDNVKFLDDLKLKASWGQTGNDRINEFQYLSSFGFVNNSWYVYNVSNISKLLDELRIPNPDVTWEVANQSNFGFDAQLLNYKLSVEADYFINMRSNILYWRNASVPSSSGLTLPRQNIGKVSNRGFETVISYRDRIGEFRYDVSVNGSYSKNKIVFWDETPGVPEYQQSTGRPMGSNLYYNAIGIFKDLSALDTYPHWAGAKPGDVIFEDVNGDGIINGLDKVRNEKSDIPRFTGGLNINLQYKQFDLAMLFQGAAGSQRYIQIESGVGGNYYKEFADNRWTPENPSTTYAKAWDFQTEYWATQASTYWLRPTDYLRLKNFEIGYSSTAKFNKRLGIDGCRIYVNGLNLLTLDKGKLIDPEVSGGQSYPLQRIVNGGLTLTF